MNTFNDSRTRKIATVLSAILVALVSIPSTASAALPSTISLTVHYQRTAGDYAGWNLWLWKNLNTGSDVDVNASGVQFTSDDAYGKVAKVEISGMEKFDSIGIIVRKGNWDLKDVASDRFITEIKADGNVEIWLRQADANIYYSMPTEPAPVAAGSALAKLYDSEEFKAKYTYSGDDLGNKYSQQETKFRVWAPTASSVSIVTYSSADSLESEGVVAAMKPDDFGTWTLTLAGDRKGLIYNYRVSIGKVVNEAVDPYVRATTVNGKRGVVIDLEETNPKNWSEAKPKFSGKATDASIYEVHVRDLSMDSSSGIPANHKGKYLAFTDLNTKSGGVLTGVSAIKDLGITHVELLPIFDYASVDELQPTFNWGYDPMNYNVPEGSYSSDPSNPTARITELKEAIQSLHNLGLRVNMDVVYNHVYNSGTFSQELIVPGYFFRTDETGSLTNGSGCGNDVASERPMVRKFIVDSVKYWASEYNIDGFRFDLMGLMDITTINQVTATLKTIDPTIIVIGEGWNMGTLPADIKASQRNIAQLNNVAHFNDQIRDGLKGSVFNATDPGWVTGKTIAQADVMAGIVGNIYYSSMFLNQWTTSTPAQSVNYVESHDNLTLADKLTASVKGITPSGVMQLSQFASSIAVLAQGVPFIQAGQEFLRSKEGDANSYKSSDSINSLKWSTKAKYANTVAYYKGLFALRAAHPAFRMNSEAMVKSNIKFLKSPENVITYSINGKAVRDSAQTIVVIHNANPGSTSVNLPNSKKWSVFVKGSKAGTKVLEVISGAKVKVSGQSTLVLVQ